MPEQAGKEIILSFKLIYISTPSSDSLKQELILLKKLLSSGLKAVQLRPRNMDSKTFLKAARSYHSLAKKYNAKFLINDRLDIALLSKADGLHCPSNGLNKLYELRSEEHT